MAPTGIEGLGVVRADTTSVLTPTVYHPVICLILQGAKELALGRERVRAAAGQSIVVSHELPLRSRVTVASLDEPYVALILRLDLELLARVVTELQHDVPADDAPGALRVGDADEDLIDAFCRLLSFRGSAAETAALAPLVIREVHVRLLLAEHGGALANMLNGNSHAGRIATATGHIRDRLAEPLSVAELAKAVGMSQSSFHEHFKSVTSTTPLQYQKDLRLLEAREQLGAGDRSITEVALAVGYRSPTQFSREYSRKFGVAPRVDRGRPVAVA
ncbi:MAG: AraC family transcriptional regulator [Actinomycetota bacterium]